MKVRGKFGALAQAFLLAVSVTALSAGMAHAQQAGDLDALGQSILDNPQDVDLNFRYAAAAEAAGKPRLALVAYERILINDPSNETARRGYERVRRLIEPSYTVTRLEVGARFDTNAENLNEDFFFTEGDSTTYFGRLMIADERQALGTRWRTIVNAIVEDNDTVEVLDYAFIGAQIGPLLYLGPHLAAIPSIGGGASMLDGDAYFNEVNFGVTLEGRAAGMSYWLRARHGYRDYQTDLSTFTFVVEDGAYTELQAGLTKPQLIFERDTLVVQPFVRWSDMDGDSFGYAPGKFEEYGAEIAYNFQAGDHIEFSVGALVREREFDGLERTDSYLSPQASVTLQRVLPCDCDVRLQYRTRENDSSDDLFDYDAEQVTLSLTTRF